MDHSSDLASVAEARAVYNWTSDMLQLHDHLKKFWKEISEEN